MDARSEIREFLTSRRGRLKAADLGLPDYGPRRVPGLRREEVAVLAGVSVPYHTRLERGDLAGASDSVLDALARALRLDDAERAHLFDLARAARPSRPRPRRRSARHSIRPSMQQLLDALTGAAAHVGNERLDILAANPLGRALYQEMFDAQERPNPYDRDLIDLVGELSTRRNEFRQHWARHDVRFHISGVKRFHHSQVGDLELNYERLDVVLDTDLTIFTYTADPGTRSAEALALLGSIAATAATERPPAAP